MSLTPVPHGVACLVLAGGGSSRFGSPKQVQLFRGETLVHRAVRAAYECGASPVVLVTGASAGKVKECVRGFESLRIAHNESWASGLSTSIAAGLSALKADDNVAAVLITLADQPLVDARCLTRLITAFDDGHRVVAASYDETMGAPALFGIEYIDVLKQLSGDKGARPWLMSMSSVTMVPMPEAAIDIDNPNDLLSHEDESERD